MGPDDTDPDNSATDARSIIDRLRATIRAQNPRQASRPKTLAHAIGRELLRCVLFVTIGTSLLVARVLAQAGGEGGGCSTMLQQLAQNGTPVLQRWAVVIAILAAMFAGIKYTYHSKPDAQRNDVESMKTAGMGGVIVLLIPDVFNLVFGQILGLQLAQCISSLTQISSGGTAGAALLIGLAGSQYVAGSSDGSSSTPQNANEHNEHDADSEDSE